MPEPIYESLKQLAAVVRWHGKYETANVLVSIAVRLEELDIREVDVLEKCLPTLKGLFPVEQR